MTSIVGSNLYSFNALSAIDRFGQFTSHRQVMIVSLTVSSLYLRPTVTFVTSDRSKYISPYRAFD